MKKIISVLLIFFLLLSVSAPTGISRAQDAAALSEDKDTKDIAEEEDFSEFDEEDEPDDPSTFPVTERQRWIDEFSTQIKKVDALFDELPQSWEEYSGSVFQLKYITEKMINASTFAWEGRPIDFLVNETQKILSEIVKPYPLIHPDKQVFKWADPAVSFSMEQKELVLSMYDQRLSDLKKAIMVISHHSPKKDFSIFRPYQLKLTSNGKSAFDQFLTSTSYDLLESDGQYEVFRQLSKDIDIELEALAEPKNEMAWRDMLKRLAIHAYVKEWVNLETLWLAKYSKSPHAPVLPQSCEDQYFSLHPLSVMELKHESEKIAYKGLLHSDFMEHVTKDKDLFIPQMIDSPIVQKLFTIIPVWSSHYENRKLVSPEAGKKLVDDYTFVLQKNEQETSIAILLRLLSKEMISDWTGDPDQIKKRFTDIVLKSKRIVFLAAVEMLLVDNKISQFMNDKNKSDLIALSEELVLPYEIELDMTVDRLYEHYESAKEKATADRKLGEIYQNPIELANMRLYSRTSSGGKDQEFGLIPQAKLVYEQDLKLEKLKRGETLPPLEDIPKNMKRVSLLIGRILKESKFEISAAANEHIQKILFEDPEFDGSRWHVEDGTYEAAYHKYQAWLKKNASSVQDPLKTKVVNEIKTVCEKFKLNQYGFISDAVSDSGVRQKYEEMIRHFHLDKDPLLKIEFENEATIPKGAIPFVSQTKYPLYRHLVAAIQKNLSHDEQIELMEKAVWGKMHIAKHELSRFCESDPNTVEGWKLLMSNETLRSAALSEYADYKSIDAESLDLLYKALEDPWYEKAVHKGFGTVIAIHLISGPLSKTPLMGRFIPPFPRAVLVAADLFGMAAAPPAIWWGIEDGLRLFKEEGELRAALDHYSNLQAQATDAWNSPVTISDMFDHDHKDKGKDRPPLVMDGLNLTVSKISYALFLPVQLTFMGSMFKQAHHLYRFGMKTPIGALRIGSERGALAYSLGKLSVPTRFWTIRSGQEALKMSNAELRKAFVSSVDQALLRHKLFRWVGGVKRLVGREELTSVERLKYYVQKWNPVVRRKLHFHKAKWGEGKTWDETQRFMQMNGERSFFAPLRGFGSSFNEDLIAERKLLEIQVRLYDEALGILNRTSKSVTSVGDIAFEAQFEKALGELGSKFNQDFISQWSKGRELEWVMGNIELHKFWKNWIGGWVGLHGPLYRASQKMSVYSYLESVKNSFSRVFSGTSSRDDLLRVLELTR